MTQNLPFGLVLRTLIYTSLLPLGFLVSGCSFSGQGLISDQEAPLDVAPDLRSSIHDGQSIDSYHKLLAPRRQPALPAPALELRREVKRELLELLKGDAMCIRVSLERRQPIFGVIQQIFHDEGVPIELTNLAVIESRFLATARSRAGAVGLWQFTRSTARHYGLRVDNTVDQRTDLILSTIAAARLLRDLYTQFDDWYLALAGYNAGSGAVGRAIRKAKSHDFWAIARSGGLSRQTRDFVPRFIAATILMRLAERNGVELLEETTQALLSRHGTSLK